MYLKKMLSNTSNCHILPIYTFIQVNVWWMATKHEKCHEGKCVSCTFCSKSNPRYIHPVHIAKKSGKAHEWLKKKYPNLKGDTCICLPCFKQIDRNCGNPKFTLGSAPNPPKTTRKCCIEACQHPLHRATSIVTAEQAQEILHERVTAFSVDASQDTLALCKECFHQ